MKTRNIYLLGLFALLLMGKAAYADEAECGQLVNSQGQSPMDHPIYELVTTNDRGGPIPPILERATSNGSITLGTMLNFRSVRQFENGVPYTEKFYRFKNFIWDDRPPHTFPLLTLNINGVLYKTTCHFRQP